MARPGGHEDPVYLRDVIETSRITVLQVVPTLLRLLVREAQITRGTSLRRVFSGGEVLAADLVKPFVGSGIELVNLYGTTEVCIDATFHVCGPEDVGRTNVTIGCPIATADVMPAKNSNRNHSAPIRFPPGKR